jgi:hypothetical protein
MSGAVTDLRRRSPSGATPQTPQQAPSAPPKQAHKWPASRLRHTMRAKAGIGASRSLLKGVTRLAGDAQGQGHHGASQPV